jgi:hypothetical protein
MNESRWCFQGNPIKPLSCDMPTKSELRERADPSVLRASLTDKELMSVCGKKSTPGEATLQTSQV